MKLFVIGGTSYIGSAVCERLQADGHELVGLARSDEAAAQLRQAGAQPVRGALSNTDMLASEARRSDGVIQLATGGFLAQALETVDEATNATDVLLDALDGTDKPYVYTGGTGMWPDTGLMNPERVVTEADPVTPPYVYAHLGSIHRKLATAERVRTIVLSPGQVYGRRGGYIGPIARLFNGVRTHGIVYAIESDNAFTFVHVDDLADLYAFAVATADVEGLYIGATDTVKQVDLAKAVSRSAGLGGEIELVSPLSMRALNGRANELDFFANCRTSSAKAQEELGWQPHRPGVFEELATLPQPVDLNSIYPAPSRQTAAAQAPL